MPPLQPQQQMPGSPPSTFNQREQLFPQDRPDIPLGMDQPKPQEPTNKYSGMPIDQQIDMEIVSTVMSRYELSKTNRRTRRLIWDKCWQNMKGIYDNAGKARWQSTTFMPLTSKVVEVIVSNLHSALFGPEMPVEWQTKRSDMDGLIRSTNELIQTDFDKCQAKAEFTDFLRNMCVMGTAVGEVGYVKEFEMVMIKQRLPKDVQDMMASMGMQQGSQSEQFIPKQMLVKDYATIKNCDLYDIYPQPEVPEFSKDSWVIHHTKITNRELKMGSMEKDPYYKFDNVTDDLLEGAGMGRIDIDPEKQTRRFALLEYNVYHHFLDPDREHDLYTMYGQIPVWYLKPELRKDKSKQYDSVPGCIKVVDGQWVIWKRLSPWRDGEPPYFKGNYIRLPTQFYGIGVAELVMGLQIEKNEIRNSRMDNINLAMNKIIAVMKDMVPPNEWQRLVSEPGAIWLFKGVDDVRKAIQQIEFGDVTKDSWMASREVDQEAQEVTAANKVTQAAGGSDSSDSGGSTFRGQMLNVQQATGRWMLYARLFEWTGLIPAMKKFYQRIYQFKDFKDAQEILGPGRAQTFQFLAPEDLEKMAKLVAVGVLTMENKGTELAQLNQYSMLWGQDPFFKRLEMARKMAVKSGIPEPDSILFSDEEMKQYNQIHQMMLTAASGGTPGTPQVPQSSGNPGQGGLLNAQGSPMQGPQTGSRGNVPGGQPVAGNTPGPLYGMPRPALPARGPGASPIDLHGRPLS